MCNAIIIITIQLQLNGQLQSKRKQKETTNKIKTSPDKALITNKVSQLITITDEPSTSILSTLYETVQY
jgi:hypothetical protein